MRPRSGLLRLRSAGPFGFAQGQAELRSGCLRYRLHLELLGGGCQHRDIARYNKAVEPVLIAALERINALSWEVNRLDGDDPAALDRLLRSVEAAASALVDGATASIAAGEWAALGGAAGDSERLLAFPLGAAERPYGALTVDLPPGYPLDRGQQLLLQSLANVAATALSQAGVHRASQRTLARKEDELALLRRAGLLISSRTGLQDTLETILQMALEVTGARYGIFRLVDRSRNALVMAAIAGADLGRPAVEALPVNVTSVMGMVAKTMQPVMIADVRQPPWSRIYYPLDHGLQMRSELAVPLLGAGGRLVGVLNLESPQPAAFTEADSHLLQSLASQAVIAIQQVRLLDALRDTSARVLTQDPHAVRSHLQALREELLSGDTEWDRKVEGILAQYETLARENAERQEALREAREARAVAETFAAMGDVAANLLHHLNNQVGTIPARVEGIQDKCGEQIAQSPYLAANLAEIERAALDAMRTVRERSRPAAAHYACARQRGRVPRGRTPRRPAPRRRGRRARQPAHFPPAGSGGPGGPDARPAQPAGQRGRGAGRPGTNRRSQARAGTGSWSWSLRTTAPASRRPCRPASSTSTSPAAPRASAIAWASAFGG